MSVFIAVPENDSYWMAKEGDHPGRALAWRLQQIIVGETGDPTWEPEGGKAGLGRWVLGTHNDWSLSVIGDVGLGNKRVLMLSGRSIAGPSEFSRKYELGLKTLLPPMMGVEILERDQVFNKAS